MALQLDHFDLLQVPAEIGGRQILQLPLKLIDEDPDQPRREFDEQTLQELALTIREGGVRFPVSVRPHPETPGRWMLNAGARRFRASHLAGCADIPAFVEVSPDNFYQAIENEQREGLKPFELAKFFRDRLAEGYTQADIARAMGKSPALVGMICSLIDAPPWLLEAYRSGTCRGILELYELRKLHKEMPQQVEAVASGNEAITRKTVNALRTNLALARNVPAAGKTTSGAPAAPAAKPMPHEETRPLRAAETSPEAENGVHESTKPTTGGGSCDAVRLCCELNGMIDQLAAQNDSMAIELLSTIQGQLADMASRLKRTILQLRTTA